MYKYKYYRQLYSSFGFEFPELQPIFLIMGMRVYNTLDKYVVVFKSKFDPHGLKIFLGEF